MPLRLLLVDDEAPARSRLRRLLGPLEDAGRVAIADDATDGVEALEKMEAAADSGDAVAAIRADREFHLAILASTGNPIIEAFDTAIDAVLGQLFRVAIEMHMENFRNNLVNHRNVLDAIERKDAASARQAMLDTIWFTRRHLERHNLTKTFS